MNTKLVTPSGIIFSGQDIKSVTIPTENGVITVMESHVPLISVVTYGEVTIEHNDSSIEVLHIAVSKGILEVRDNGEVFVLVQTAEKADDIDIDRAEEAKIAAEEFLKKKIAVDDVAFAHVQAKLEKELARLEVGRRWKRL